MRQIRTLLPSTTAALVAVAAMGAQAQAQLRVTGTVTGEGGTPLAGATVQIVGTQTGTYTNESGRFAIQAGAGTQQLRVRRIGYRAQVVTVGAGQTDVGSVALTRDVLQLEAQVVTGTATSVSRANAANAVTTVNADQLVGRAPAQTVDNALQGKVAGAIISQNSGAPGGGTQVQIRGVTSINASTAPLYVVDGVLINNQSVGNGLNLLTQAGAGISNSQDQQVNRVADLAPEEIESIEILKGPAAGAIYGSKGSNGVIVIRTKRGSTGAPQFNSRLALGNYSLQKNRKLPFRCFQNASQIDAIYGKGVAAAYGVTGAAPCYDYQDEFFSSSGPSYNTNLDVRGGTAGGTTYYVSGGAQRDNAIQKGTFYQKQAIAANLGQTVGKRLTLQFNNNFVHTLADRGISGNDNSPIVSPVDVFVNTPTFINLANKVNGLYPVNTFLLPSSNTNPFQTAEVVKLPQDVYRYIGNINGTYNAYASDRQTLDVTLLGGVDVTAQQNKIYSPPTAYFEPLDGFPGTQVNTNYNAQFANLNLSAVHRYTASPFTATTSLGVRREYRNSDLVFNQGRNIAANTYTFTGGVQSNSETRSQIRDLAYYIQEEFLTLQERLLLTAAINAERSSVNGDPNHFYAFPKFSASYRLPIAIPQTDQLKLRIAYGKAGNQPLYGYAFTGLPVGLYSGDLGAGISSIYGNQNIKPEISTEVEGGVDWNLFRGRLAIEATLFRTNISDLILQRTPAPSTGFTTQYLNSGSMYKTGTELQVSAIPVQAKSFSWNTRVSFSTVNSRVKSLGGVPCFTVGFFGFGDPYVCDGSGGTSASKTGYSVTTIRVPNGGATPNVYTYLESLPRFITGFSNDFQFGPVRFSGLLDWRYGGYAQNLTLNTLDNNALNADTAGAAARVNAQNNGDLRPYNQRTTFVKLRELNLSYAVPGAFTQRYLGGRAKDLRLEVAGRNLVTWSKYGGYDPEVSNFSNVNLGRGQDVTPYPPSRSFFVAVTTGF